MTEPNTVLRGVLKVGASLVASVPAAAAAFIGMPIQAAGAALAIGAVEPILYDFCLKMLSPREKARVGATALAAATVFSERQMVGDEPRADWFGAEGDAEQAGQLFEDLLMKARAEHDPRKVIFLGAFWGNAAFERIPLEDLFALARVADHMSYRQLLLLDLLIRQEEFAFDPNAMLRISQREALGPLTLEWTELRSPSLAVVEPQGSIESPRLRGTRLGRDLHRLMSLSRLAQVEGEALRDQIEIAPR